MKQIIKIDTTSWSYDSTCKFIKWLIAIGFNVAYKNDEINATRTEQD